VKTFKQLFKREWKINLGHIKVIVGFQYTFPNQYFTIAIKFVLSLISHLRSLRFGSVHFEISFRNAFTEEIHLLMYQCYNYNNVVNCQLILKLQKAID